jgi:PHP family Zn ribbon phosphoesterase
MELPPIIYNKWTCSQCNQKYSTKQGTSTSCPTCYMPIHREIAKRIGTKVNHGNNINYDKYLK